MAAAQVHSHVTVSVCVQRETTIDAVISDERMPNRKYRSIPMKPPCPIYKHLLIKQGCIAFYLHSRNGSQAKNK